MLAKAKNGHTNIWYILLLNFVATYNIRSPTQDSEKEIVLCKKGDDITRFDGSYLFTKLFHNTPILARTYLFTLLYNGLVLYQEGWRASTVQYSEHIWRYTNLIGSPTWRK
jgi:hypothetical protein